MNRWSPSRHHFALARLIAFIVSRRAGSDHSSLMLLADNHDQSAIENYFVSIWFSVTAICYVAAALPMPAVLSAIAAVPLATIAFQIPMCVGLPTRVSSVVLMLLIFSASAYFASTTAPIRYVAWLSLVIFCANAIAWVFTRWLDI
jgi:hypothetical protein